MTVSGSYNGTPLQFLCTSVNVNSLSIGGLVLALVQHSTETTTSLSIIKKIKCPRNYVFGVYFHDKNTSTLAFFSNKGNKPTRVLPIKKGENIDRKFGYFELGGTLSQKKHKIYDFHIFTIDCPVAF